MKKTFLFFLLALILIFALFLYFSQKAPSTDTSKKAFVVNQGDSLMTIATRLEQYKFIHNRYTFVLFSQFLGLNKKIQAGTFYLSPSQPLSDLIKRMAKGGSTDYWLKIIPGTRLEEFSPSEEFSAAATGLEGQLYPDSYLIPIYFTPPEILNLIDKNFAQKISQASLNSSTPLNASQTLIMASLLEREAKTLADKKIIAGILLNRLNSGMPLQIDATVQYAKDSLTKPQKYWKPIAKADLGIVSPYNTYKNPGFPPAPICNPALDSLTAAYHPTDTDYVYYISDNSGTIHYAKTLDEHNANVAKYLR